MDDVEVFSDDLRQRIRVDAESEELPLEAAFTKYMLAVLNDAGEIEDGEVAFHSSHGVAVSGFCVSDDDIVDLVISDYRDSPGVRTLGKAEVAKNFSRLSKFKSKVVHGLAASIEESQAAWNMADVLETRLPSAERIRLTLLTNARVKGDPPTREKSDQGTARVTYHIWDIERLQSLESSGRDREPISVDFGELSGGPLGALGPQGVEGDYEAYLLLIPGNVLADIYEEYGSRLLELNVRSFLQARGKVNRGIQQTIKDQPHRFLAYNNGISMTASRVETMPVANGGNGILRLHDLQIVNGGQTTASLFHARLKSRRDPHILDGINVQAKLSVVEPDHLADLVPLISEYANSQNVVRTADFSANDPFQVELEKLSRTIWAPAREDSQQLTRWFYERARGQYADALAMERTPARQRAFKTSAPPQQKFTKTDLAKFELTWNQRPELVALGAERCFREFTLILGEKAAAVPDSNYFQQAVAKAIMFRRAENIIGALKLGGYRSQAVTYTLALMSLRANQQIDLDMIWRAQDISDSLAVEIGRLGAEVHRVLLASAATANVSEWAKKPAAWDSVKRINWTAPNDVLAKSEQTAALNLEEEWTEEARGAALRVLEVNRNGWQDLIDWGTKSKKLSVDQRRKAAKLRDLQMRAGDPTPSLMLAGKEILEVADEHGWDY